MQKSIDGTEDAEIRWIVKQFPNVNGGACIEGAKLAKGGAAPSAWRLAGNEAAEAV